MPALALGKDRSAYTTFCEAILEVPVDELEIEERGIKVCCLWPGIIGPDRLSDRLTAESLATGNHVAWFPVWGWGTRALLALRKGDAESAIRFILKAENLPPEKSARAMNLVVLALAEHRLEHGDAARRALREAKQVAAEIKRDHDWLIARILIEEAEAALADE